MPFLLSRLHHGPLRNGAQWWRRKRAAAGSRTSSDEIFRCTYERLHLICAQACVRASPGLGTEATAPCRCHTLTHTFTARGEHVHNRLRLELDLVGVTKAQQLAQGARRRADDLQRIHTPRVRSWAQQCADGLTSTVGAVFLARGRARRASPQPPAFAPTRASQARLPPGTTIRPER